MILAWAAAGVLFLVGFVYSIRIMRRGMTTLDDSRSLYLERIREGERRLLEDKKNMPLDEHMRILHAGVRDLLALAGDPSGHHVECQGRVVLLHTPKGPWRVELFMREALLRGSGKTVFGQSRWRLSGFDREEHFQDLAGLMRALHEALRDEGSLPPQPSHLARRISHEIQRDMPSHRKR